VVEAEEVERELVRASNDLDRVGPDTREVSPSGSNVRTLFHLRQVEIRARERQMAGMAESVPD
jgi:hypothetical protein